MATFIKSVTFDAADALALAKFWAAALGSDVDEDSTSDKANARGGGLGRPEPLVQPRPRAEDRQEPRALRPARPPGPLAAEVARLERLGATVTGRHPDLTVMADPEGNEFCVEPGPAASP